jgi:CHAT domain-containing protein/tetratricopeptide (TPR) repeat protein
VLVLSVYLASSIPVPGQALQAVNTDPESVRELLARGAYADAERRITALTEALDIRDDTASVEQVRLLDLLVEARVRNGKAGEPATLEAARRAVRLNQRLDGNDGPGVAVALHNLGTAHVERGEFTAALEHHQRALTIRARRASPTDPLLADSLEHVAQTQVLLESLAAARKTIDRALLIREAAAASAPDVLAQTLELSALWHRYAGNYTAGLELLNRVRSIRAGTKGASPNVPFLDLHGDLLYLSGDIGGARRAWSDGLALAEQTLDLEHPALALFLRKLAAASDAFGNRTDARALLDRALKIGTRRLPPCHPEIAGLLNDSAQSAQRDGDFAQAKDLFQRQLKTLEKCHTNANWTATALHNYAGLFLEMGDLAEAERLHSRAVQAWSTGLGPHHPYVARGLDSLAEVVASRGQPGRARLLYQRALTIRRGQGHERPEVAWTLTNLARTLVDLGNLQLARRRVEEAIAIYRKSGAFDEPDHLARALELHGAIQSRQGSVAEAPQTLTAALAERERIHGPSHPLVAQSRAMLAGAQFLAGTPDLALASSLDAERVGRDHLRFTVRFLSERQALVYADKRPRGLDLALSVAAAGFTSSADAVFDALIRSRGLVLEELAVRARAVDAPQGETAASARIALRARQRYANLLVRSLKEPVSRTVLDEARAEKELAEEALARESVVARVELSRARFGLQDLRRLLPPGAALVSFVIYDRSRLPPKTSAAGSPRVVRSYAAFVQRADGGAHFVRLGTAAFIDASVAAWRQELAVGATESAYKVAAARLRGVVWDPLETHVAGATRVFIVPDGLLNVVNIASLTGRDGRFLIERGPVIHYLSTERDLDGADAAAPGSGLLAVGGAAFDPVGQVTARSAAARAGCDEFGQVRFENLPGTSREVDDIRRLWPSRDSGAITVLSGAAATESAVKGALPGRRVVHLATHGFFSHGECRTPAGNVRGVGGLVVVSRARHDRAENPLLLAGLALAGANRRNPKTTDQDDGMLTAEEVASLDLRGTEWAVLSACDTGLGEIKAGEGVFGLRRAFQIAGARTVIMSLWSVDDQVTRSWMRALYDGRLNKNLSTADAVRQASLTVLQDRRARGLSAHPFYWSAFIAAGDWR